MREYRENKLGLKVLTDTGYMDFAGIAIIGEESIYRVDLEDELFIECSGKHKLLSDNFQKLSVYNQNVGNLIHTFNGPKKIISITKTDRIEPVYDLIEVDGNHRYYTNNILSSNCEFISSDETLIASDFLTDSMTYKNDIFRIGNTRWFKEPVANHIYGLTLDPSMGTGGDPAAIQVFDLTTMEQVAEWKDNRTPTEKQIGVINDILSYIYQTLLEDPKQKGEPDLYWTFENNSCGEGIVVALRLIGEDRIPATLLSEKGKRTGMWTGPKSKMSACSIFKRMVEKRKLIIYSQPLISQLKGFVYSAGTFKAKPGMNDDLVMAMIVMIRLYEAVTKWEDNVADEGDILEDLDDESSPPMPMAFL